MPLHTIRRRFNKIYVLCKSRVTRKYIIIIISLLSLRSRRRRSSPTGTFYNVQRYNKMYYDNSRVFYYWRAIGFPKRYFIVRAARERIGVAVLCRSRYVLLRRIAVIYFAASVGIKSFSFLIFRVHSTSGLVQFFWFYPAGIFSPGSSSTRNGPSCTKIVSSENTRNSRFSLRHNYVKRGVRPARAENDNSKNSS